MKYHLGLYGGSFNPLHIGHLNCIIHAAGQCDKLLVVISNSIPGEVDIKVRYRWVYELTKHIGNVEIFVLECFLESKDKYTEKLWIEDARKVKAFANDKIDAVFCGSDYDKNSFWAKCYPEAELVFFDFDRANVSSSAVRKNVYGSWHLLPNIVKEYYVKKVLIVGIESTGKSTLTINLANYFQTEYVEEVGRELSAKSGTDKMMISQDFTEILLAHKLKEMKAISHCNKVLFEDTDCLITKFFIDFLNDNTAQENSPLADAIAHINTYDLILFLEPDVDFVQDGDRSLEIATNKDFYSNKIKDLYINRGFNVKSISGNYNERFDQAVKFVNEILK